MTPAEIMAKAFLDHDPCAYDAVGGMRAALRALAEMDPTEKMDEAATARIYAQGGPVDLTDYCKNYILAAAAEGENT